ncbi:Putative K(+)-stimulated pyrophosphate-energized sodium pump [Lacipirellula limnantheis]|uniref:K(+)-insensitive pyrophosphate-energized proton pump n=2 Tax=Lacipirellula limnantheis TaxID=2528024 RepID=A0A517TU05_9BACT|nr:Putative K(+)-stimulated pyrophosphate-energized sodium pump [Lacipirellula limnantheis]
MHMTPAETDPSAATHFVPGAAIRRCAVSHTLGIWMKRLLLAVAIVTLNAAPLLASEADLAIPDLHAGKFTIFGNEISGYNLLLYGSFVICGTLGISLYLRRQIAMLPAHESMLKVAEIIYQTCRTYLIQQGKFLIMLFLLIAAAMAYYFLKLQDETLKTTALVLLFSIIGMIGSYSVAWYGIRVNTFANARTAFASLRGEPLDVVNIPLRAGMSIGLFLISLELVMMVIILLFLPREIVGYCFLGFAIGESLGASVLRIAGGIFTKIADIGSDLMKIVFNVKEDDPRNPGVIADCTGDNAGDSVGPTADGFETYGVTGVALIAFITLAVPNVDIQAKLIVWLFAMRFLMDFMSGVSYFINQAISETKYRGLKEFDFEAPLTRLIWIAAILCITTSFGMSWLLIGDITVGGKAMPQLWWQLATIIGCGTLAAVLIPEFTKIFTSSHSKHVHEIVTASREGGPSLTILSGIVAGNFSAFWNGMLITGLMSGAYFVSLQGLDELMMVTLQEGLDPVGVGSIFAFGLVAFGFLCMGPVNIAVDSYGPVTDNAQSIFELAQTEQIPGINEQIKRDFGFDPDFKMGKHYLEANDSAGNTFKATAKPVLIGTAVVGATTMIFSIILLLGRAGYLRLSLTDAPVLLGFMAGGSVIYWFCGASMQAVTTGAYRAVEYIKKNMDLTKTEADIEDSKAVVKICTLYAQKGMWNIFIALMAITLAFAFFDPNFFVAYLVSIAVFGLFQAIYMANAGGAWDNAKKLVEVDLKEKGTDLHAASVIGDTVGDPFKDTSSVALNPIIKFSTLFGLLAVEIAVKMKEAAHASGARDYTGAIGAVMLAIALVFVWRSFYAMRIPKV